MSPWKTELSQSKRSPDHPTVTQAAPPEGARLVSPMCFLQIFPRDYGHTYVGLKACVLLLWGTAFLVSPKWGCITPIVPQLAWNALQVMDWAQARRVRTREV